MKVLKILIILIFGLFFQVNLKGQNSQYSIVLNPKMCDSLINNRNIDYFIGTIKQGNDFIKELKFNGGRNNKPPYKIGGLKNGLYNLEYSNFYGQKTIINFKIDNSTIKNYSFCYDSITEKTSLKFLIDSLNINDSLKIIVKSQGCYHSFVESLILIKNENGFKGILDKIERENDKLIHKTTTTNLDITFVDFIIYVCERVFISKDFLSTNSESFLFYKNDTAIFGFMDFGCRVNGFAIIKNRFFSLKN